MLSGTLSATCSDALRLDPNSPDVMSLRGLVLFLTAKTAQALQHAQSALRLDPGHDSAQRLRKRVKDVERLKEEGNTAFKAGILEEATEKYGEALDVSILCAPDPPTNPRCTNTRISAAYRRAGGGRKGRTDSRDATV